MNLLELSRRPGLDEIALGPHGEEGESTQADLLRALDRAVSLCIPGEAQPVRRFEQRKNATAWCDYLTNEGVVPGDGILEVRALTLFYVLHRP